MTKPPKLNAIVPFLPCADISKTLAYYRDMLGFSHGWEWGEPLVAAGMRRDGVWIFFTHDPELAAKMAGFRVYFDIDGVDELFDLHKAAGAKIVDPLDEKPWGTFEYTIEEINGYLLHFRRAPE